MKAATRAIIERIERETGQPIARVLAADFNTGGYAAVARRLGVGVGSVNYWLCMTGVRVERRACGLGEEPVVVSAAAEDN